MTVYIDMHRFSLSHTTNETQGVYMSTIQALWTNIQQIYERSQSEKVLDRQDLFDLEDGISRMRDDKPILLNIYCATIEAHPEYFARCLLLKGTHIHFRARSFLSHRDVRHRFMDLIKASPMWEPLYDKGAFELLEMLVIGDARGKSIPSISYRRQTRLLPFNLKPWKYISAGTFVMGALETQQRASISLSIR